MPHCEGNLFDRIGDGSDEEQLSDLLKSSSLKIERIVSTGQATEAGIWLDQAWSEWVLVVSGTAEILFEDEIKPRFLKAGDYLFIPPHARHRVTRTDRSPPTIWLAVHFGDRV